MRKITVPTMDLKPEQIEIRDPKVFGGKISMGGLIGAKLRHQRANRANCRPSNHSKTLQLKQELYSKAK